MWLLLRYLIMCMSHYFTSSVCTAVHYTQFDTLLLFIHSLVWHTVNLAVSIITSCNQQHCIVFSPKSVPIPHPMFHKFLSTQGDGYSQLMYMYALQEGHSPCLSGQSFVVSAPLLPPPLTEPQVRLTTMDTFFFFMRLYMLQQLCA